MGLTRTARDWELPPAPHQLSPPRAPSLTTESQGLGMVLTISAPSVWPKETEFWPSRHF